MRNFNFQKLRLCQVVSSSKKGLEGIESIQGIISGSCSTCQNHHLESNIIIPGTIFLFHITTIFYHLCEDVGFHLYSTPPYLGLMFCYCYGFECHGTGNGSLIHAHLLFKTSKTIGTSLKRYA